MEKGQVSFREKKKKYELTQTEILLENLCEAFETKLEQAHISFSNGWKLIRLSEPVILDDKLIQIQYSRFSPFHSKKAINFYRKNAKKNKLLSLDAISLHCELHKKGNEFDKIQLLTNPKYIKHLNITTWGEACYFAIFDVNDEEKDDLISPEPFLIDDKETGFEGELSDLHMALKIEPRYSEAEYGSYKLTFDFPKIVENIENTLESALSLHMPYPSHLGEEPFDFLCKNQETEILFSTEISYKVPREIIMGFIYKYMKNYLFE